MLLTARANLRPAFGARVSFAQVSLPACRSPAGPISSSARRRSTGSGSSGAVRQHLRALRPGGRLLAQCGGGAEPRARARARRAGDARARRSRGISPAGRGPGSSPTPRSRAERLRAAGFVDIDTSLEEAPTTLATEADYREFVTTVIYHPHLERLPDAALKQAFIDGSPNWRPRRSAIHARLLAPQHGAPADTQ